VDIVWIAVAVVFLAGSGLLLTGVAGLRGED
jgi:hypothetical protein